MRKAMTLSLEENIITELKRKAVKKHLPASKIAEEILRKALRLKT